MLILFIEECTFALRVDLFEHNKGSEYCPILSFCISKLQKSPKRHFQVKFWLQKSERKKNLNRNEQQSGFESFKSVGHWFDNQ